MKYKLIIFDLDGTVLDTLEDLADSVNFALKKNSLPERNMDEIRAFVGNGIRLLIERAVPVNSPATLVDCVFNDFKEYYKIHNSDKTKPYDGIPEMLRQLKEKGYKTAVVSNKADFAVQTLVKKYFDGLFDYFVGERDGIAKKPAPDSVYGAMRFFSADNNLTVYVGDSEVDVETAKNADIDLICVDWGFRCRRELLESGADNIVSDIKGLLKSITEN